MTFIIPAPEVEHPKYEFRFKPGGKTYYLPAREDLTLGEVALLESGSVEKLVEFFPENVRDKIRRLRPVQVEALIRDWLGDDLGKSEESSDS